jgi:formylglycine-generating enzyme required for sulfatase activity
VQASVEAAEAERQREVARQQREINDAKRLAEAAQARAQAERRATVRARWLLIVVSLIAIALAVQPIYQSQLRQQALTPLVSFDSASAILGQGDGKPDEFLPHQTYQIAGFALEPYEVTNARYDRCLRAGVCSAPQDVPAQFSADTRGDYPVVNVSALQAKEFCEWLGRRLPIEIEWEYAARSDDERLWPWGNDRPATDAQANFFYGNDSVETHQVGPAYGEPFQSGIVYDLAGNVWEWTSSAYTLGQPDWIDDSSLPSALSARGGSANVSADTMQSIAERQSWGPASVDRFLGFRCAVSH